MRRTIVHCVLSIAIYIMCGTLLLDRPLTTGVLRSRIEMTLAAGRAVEESKLVIIAGSNAPYSHRCEVIGLIVGRSCVNGGIAVGIGLDYLFARWKKLLRPGDIVYLPLEEAQYVRSRAANALGPDAAIMLRHDRATLLALPPERMLGAVFSTDLRGIAMSLIETVLAADGFHDPRAAAEGTVNALGDHIGHTAALGVPNQPALLLATPFHPTQSQVTDGYGAALVADFLDWAARHGVLVVGGLPTGFADSPIPEASIAAIRNVFRQHHAEFLELPNRSRYPRQAFFDSQDHLNEEAQIGHSLLVARALAGTSRGMVFGALTGRISAPTP